ncbi:MAG: glycosyltransferase, partial [Candidatus Omnitrophota bacterium]
YRMKIPGADVINKPWELSNEVDDFRSIDIGVYPLPDNEWTRGKTGFKTIQYMSVGIPCVVSNTGANKNIVRDGINGYLADTEDEWIDRISLLIENAGLRKKIGDAGRKTVEESFSVKANVPEYMRIIRKVSE